MQKKKCSKCHRLLPATNKFFSAMKLGKFGLRFECKKCQLDYNRQHREANREAIRERRHAYYLKNQERLKKKSFEYHELNIEKIRARKRKYQIEHSGEIKIKQHEFYLRNKEEILKNRCQYAEVNSEKISEAHKKYYQKNRKDSIWLRAKNIMTTVKKFCERVKNPVLNII